jgi:hypothetical protein
MERNLFFLSKLYFFKNKKLVPIILHERNSRIICFLLAQNSALYVRLKSTHQERPLALRVKKFKKLKLLVYRYCLLILK